jgi:hypothetical protein
MFLWNSVFHADPTVATSISNESNRSGFVDITNKILAKETYRFYGDITELICG